MRRDMDELIRGQIELQQQVRELKAMLQTAPPRPQNTFTNFLFDLDGVTFQGSAKATVAMIEFSDSECPFCAAYTTETFPWIEHDYINTAKLRYGLVNFPLAMHPHAAAAAAAVDCAGLLVFGKCTRCSLPAKTISPPKPFSTPPPGSVCRPTASTNA